MRNAKEYKAIRIRNIILELLMAVFSIEEKKEA